MEQHGPWTIHQHNQVYGDPWLQVFRDEVTRPDGQPGSYSTVEIKSGVCVIALDDDETVHLTKEFHYAVGRDTIEGVSGGIEASDESPLVAAERELAEELGLKANDWTHLCTIDPFTAAVRSTVDLYLAKALSECESSPEGTELIERVSMPLSEAVQKVKQSQITHGPTCVALLHLALEIAERNLAR